MDIKEIKAVFDVFVNDDGKLAVTDIGTVIRALGIYHLCFYRRIILK